MTDGCCRQRKRGVLRRCGENGAGEEKEDAVRKSCRRRADAADVLAQKRILPRGNMASDAAWKTAWPARQ